jgi:folate-binding protein YgfZ
MGKLTFLDGRGVVAVAGEDRVSFLQGLVSNDVTEAGPGRAVWAALLTPQGKWLADFFILDDPQGARLLLDCERVQAPMLISRLMRYRLRAKVEVHDLSGARLVHAAWGTLPALPPEAIAAPDPRLPEAGWRIIAPERLPATASPEDYDTHRIALGLPDGSRDLEAEKSVLLEAGFDELNGVSWGKGCYMGQELTARTKYRGLVKRRLVPVAIEGEGSLPAPGAIVRRDGAEVGTLRSVAGTMGLALLRLEALTGPLRCGEARLTPRIPAWMALPEPAA